MREKIASVCVAAACAFAAPAHAADFYAGKTISMSTHSDAGSGYDSYLRILARFYGRHIAGNPNFIILNMPGGGGLTAINQAGRIAPKDGTFLTLVSQGLLVIQATGGKGLQVSLGDFNWLGNFSQTNNVTVAWHMSPVKTLRDAQQRETLVGATGAGSATVVGPTLYNALVGTRFKIIQGYTGTGAINLAMQRGELDGHANSTWASLKTTLGQEFREGKINVLIQMGLHKEKDLPDTPLLADLVTGDDRKEALAQFMSSAVSIARPFAAPPGVPADRVELLRRAFDATMADPEFQAEAEKLGLDVDPMTGEETQAAVARVISAPKAVIQDMADILAAAPH